MKLTLTLWAAVIGLVACAAPPAPAASSEPIATETVTVLALGLSCPNCALNVVLQLERFPGIEIGELDMGRGALPLRFTQHPHPSEYDIANAVRRAGYTYVGLEKP
jgi:hypothetical protein